MPRALVLPDFSQEADKSQQPKALLAEEERLAAYENGYKAGWDDAASAEHATHEKVSADLAQNLRDLSFTFAEARTHVLNGIGPLLTLMAEKLLPEAGREGFCQTVLQTVMSVADQASQQPIELVVNPEHHAAVTALLEQKPVPMPVSVIQDRTLGPGQAFVRAASGETAIDIDSVEAAVRTAVAAFLLPEEEERKHG